MANPSDLREKVVYRLDRYVQGARRDEAVDALLRLIDEERDAARREAFENAAKVCEEAAADADRVANQMRGLDWPHSATAMAAAAVGERSCAAAIRALGAKP